jgi:arabinofuranosyltransferase
LKRRFSLELISLGLIIGLFLLWSSVFICKSSTIAIDGRRYFSLFDDAMVSMRYGWNLSHGFGLVWNPGERVEGYTNLLMTLLMALSTLVFDKVTAVLAIQLLGILFMIVSALLAGEIAVHLMDSESAAWKVSVRLLVVFATLFYYPLAYWSLMGMETGLLTMLILTAVLTTFRFMQTKQRADLWKPGVFCGLAYLSRPDSVLFSAVLFALIFFDIWKTKSDRNERLIALGAFGLLIAFIGGQTLFRWLYYGELLPNTYTLKVAGTPLSVRLRGGFDYIKPYLKSVMPLFLLAASDVLFNHRRQKLVLFLLWGIAVFYTVLVGGDAWPYWRLTAPTMPLALVLATLGAEAFVKSLSETGFFRSYFLRKPLLPERFVPAFLAAVTVISVLGFSDYGFRREIFFLQKLYTTGANAWNVNIALAIREVTTENASVGTTAAGVMPYYSGRRAIDYLGKSDKYIAHLPPDLSGAIEWRPGHIKYSLEYSLKQLQPTYTETFEWGGQDLTEWASTRYVIVGYKGVSLRLLKNSPDVLWEKLGR